MENKLEIINQDTFDQKYTAAPLKKEISSNQIADLENGHNLM